MVGDGLFLLAQLFLVYKGDPESVRKAEAIVHKVCVSHCWEPLARAHRPLLRPDRPPAGGVAI